MVNLDLAISVGIWVAGLGTSLIGIEMTITPPTGQNAGLKWVYRGLFIGLGIAFIGLSIWQSDRTAKGAAKDRQDTIAKVTNPIATALSAQNGQLNDIASDLRRMAESSADPARIKHLASRIENTNQNFYAQISDPSLAALATNIGTRLFTLQYNWHHEIRDINEGYSKNIVGSSAEGRKQLKEIYDKRTDVSTKRFEAGLWSILPEANLVRGEAQQRLNRMTKTIGQDREVEELFKTAIKSHDLSHLDDQTGAEVISEYFKNLAKRLSQ